MPGESSNGEEEPSDRLRTGGPTERPAETLALDSTLGAKSVSVGLFALVLVPIVSCFLTAAGFLLLQTISIRDKIADSSKDNVKEIQALKDQVAELALDVTKTTAELTTQVKILEERQQETREAQDALTTKLQSMPPVELMNTLRALVASRDRPPPKE